MRFIEDHRDRYAVALMLRVLQISESTYYGWIAAAGQPCNRELEDRGLLSNIYEIWTASGRTYGADRVYQQLHRDGIRVGRKRVERLMAAQGWQGAYCDAAGGAAPPARTHGPPQPRIWSTGTSPRRRRTC